MGLEELREMWITERPRYEAFARHVHETLELETRRRGLRCEVYSRPKDVASFLKKALRKNYSSPYDEIHDKAGVRVVVTFADEVRTVAEIVERIYQVRHYEDKTLGMPPDRLGYLGVHYEVALRAESPEWGGLLCEIQLHTRAQSLWANVSHLLVYKPGQEPPVEVKRRIHRLMALVELFDEQIMDAKRTIMNLPMFTESQRLEKLEEQFYRLTAKEFDRDLSLEIIAGLESLYSKDETERFGDIIERFIAQNEEKLQDIFTRYRDDARCNALLFQPESLLIFERLEADEFRLKDAWSRRFPVELLEGLAAIWGVAV